MNYIQYLCKQIAGIVPKNIDSIEERAAEYEYAAKLPRREAEEKAVRDHFKIYEQQRITK